jgi:hypothetical protein
LLLVTTSAQKRVGLDLKIASGEGLIVPGTGPVENLDLALLEGQLELRATVRRSDVTAARGDTEERRISLPHHEDQPDLVGLQAALRDIKALDPGRQRISLLPTDAVPASTLVAVMDAVRADQFGPLFPTPLLGSAP